MLGALSEGAGLLGAGAGAVGAGLLAGAAGSSCLLQADKATASTEATIRVLLIMSRLLFMRLR